MTPQTSDSEPKNMAYVQSNTISSMNRIMQRMLDPYVEALKSCARYRTFEESVSSQKRNPLTLPLESAQPLPLEARLSEIRARLISLEARDDVTREEQRKPFLWCSAELKHVRNLAGMYETLTKDIQFTPEQLFAVYATKKPSEMTRSNFRVITDHDIAFTGDPLSIFHVGETDITNYARRYAERLFSRIELLKESHPSKRDVLTQEYAAFCSVIQRGWMVSAYYLNSLDIPFGVKELYPSAEPQDPSPLNLVAQKFEEVYNAPTKWILNKYHLFKKRHKESHPTLTRSALYATIALDTVYSLPLLISEALFSIAKDKTARLINKIKRNDSSFIPLSEGEPNEQFWLYFKYHPEKDVPVDFSDESFVPPGSAHAYLPRRLFKQAIHDLHRSIGETYAYYRSHDVPLDDPEIAHCRMYLLRHIDGIDQFVQRQINKAHS